MVALWDCLRDSLMDLNYKLKENDYLQFHLYFAKEEGKVRKEIIRGFVVWFIILSLISIVAYKGVDNPFSYLFPIGSILSLIFLPHRLKDHLFKSYQKHSKAYKNEFDKNVCLKIDDAHIYQISVDTEGKFKISTIEVVIETGRYFYIKLLTGCIIIPKGEVDNINPIQHELETLSEKLNINYKLDLDWKW